MRYDNSAVFDAVRQQCGVRCGSTTTVLCSMRYDDNGEVFNATRQQQWWKILLCTTTVWDDCAVCNNSRDATMRGLCCQRDVTTTVRYDNSAVRQRCVRRGDAVQQRCVARRGTITVRCSTLNDNGAMFDAVQRSTTTTAWFDDNSAIQQHNGTRTIGFCGVMSIISPPAVSQS